MASLNYLGSKKTLLPFLSHVMSPLLSDCTVFCDLFAGTGCVFNHFAGCCHLDSIVANDMELYAHVLNCALLKCSYSNKIAMLIDQINISLVRYSKPGLVAKHFASNGRMYFSLENAMAIDGARIAIDKLYHANAITYSEFIFLLASLLVSASAVSNTCGTFRAHLKHMSARSKKRFKLAAVHYNRSVNQKHNTCFKKDAINVAVPRGSLVYLDPPYNSAHYGAYYSFLNYLCEYNKNNTTQGTGTMLYYNKSRFGLVKTACESFKTLISETCKNAKHIVLSYSSCGVVPIQKLIQMMEARSGCVTVYKTWYKAYKSAAATNSGVNRNRGHVIEYMILAKHCDREIHVGKRTTRYVNLDSNHL